MNAAPPPPEPTPAHAPRPNLLRLGNGSRSLPLLAALLPKRLLEAALKKRFGLNRSL